MSDLLEAAKGLKRIVEEIDGTMNHGTWRDAHGVRLKDTAEWVALYLAVATANTTQPDLSLVAEKDAEIARLREVLRKPYSDPEVDLWFTDRKLARSYEIAALWHDKQAALFKGMSQDVRSGEDGRAKACQAMIHHAGSAAGLRIRASDIRRAELSL